MSVISGFFSPLLTAYITKVLEWGEGNERKMVGIFFLQTVAVCGSFLQITHLKAGRKSIVNSHNKLSNI